jgi:hypothetical protein
MGGPAPSNPLVGRIGRQWPPDGVNPELFTAGKRLMIALKQSSDHGLGVQCNVGTEQAPLVSFVIDTGLADRARSRFSTASSAGAFGTRFAEVSVS